MLGLLALLISVVHGKTNPSYPLYWGDDPKDNDLARFYVPFDTLTLADNTCRVQTINAESNKVLPFDSQTINVFSPLVAFNSTTSTALPILSETGDYILLDYRIVKYAPTQAYELSLTYNISARSISMAYTELSLNSLQFSQSTQPSKTTLSNVLQLHLDRPSNREYHVGFELTNDILKFYFKITYFNLTVSAQFRKIQIFEQSVQGYSNAALGQLLRDFKLVALGSFSTNRQFIVYRRSSPVVYLITSFNGLEKSGRLTLDTLTLPFPVNRVQYLESQFLFITNSITISDASGNNISSYMNYYTVHDIGKQLNPAQILSFKNISIGRILGTYQSLDRTLLLLDVLVPNVGGAQTDTLVSSFYWSDKSQAFELFLEQAKTTPQGLIYDPRYYMRICTPSHIIEIYHPSLSPQPILSLHSRRQDQTLGTVLLPIKMPIRLVQYLQAENIILIKYIIQPDSPPTAEHTQIIVLSDPYLLYSITPNQTETARRALQIVDDPSREVYLTVECQSAQSAQWNNRLKAVFPLISHKNEYFEAIRSNAMEESTLISTILSNLTKAYTHPRVIPAGTQISMPTSHFIRGSFMEANTSSSGSSAFNPNLRPEYFLIKLPNLRISMPVFFESIDRNKVSRTLILDIQSKTSYYRASSNRFNHVKDAVDSRNITSVDLLNGTEALVNISKNVFSLSTQTLRERPLTGIGSFCINVEALRPPGLDEIMVCITRESLHALLSNEKFLPTQTKLPIVQPELEALLRKNLPIRLMTSTEFPGIIYILTHNDASKVERSYQLHVFDIFADMSLIVSFSATFDLPDLSTYLRENAQTDDLMVTEAIDNHIVFASRSSQIYVYHMRLAYKPGQKYALTFMRYYNLQDHFLKYNIDHFGQSRTIEFEPRVIKYEVIRLLEHSSDQLASENESVKRLAMLVEVYNKYFQKRTYSVVVFDHTLSTFDAYSSVFSGDRCVRVYIGPAFLSNGERMEKSLAIMCVEGTPGDNIDPDQSYEGKIYILETHKSKVGFQSDATIESIQNIESADQMSKAMQIKSFNIDFFKTQYLLDILQAKRTPEMYGQQYSRIFPSKSFNLNYSETYKPTRPRLIGSGTEYVSDNIEYTLLGTLRSRVKTVIQRKVSDYFEGHIFSLGFACEAALECREGVINGTGQQRSIHSVAEFGDLNSLQEYKVGIARPFDEPLPYLITSEEVKLGSESFPLTGLTSECSESQSYENYIFFVCENGVGNYFRVFDLSQNLQWMDIPFILPSNRRLQPKSLHLKLSENYLMINTYNVFFNKQLTVYLFKICHDPGIVEPYLNTRIFKNNLVNKIAMIYLTEHAMNDEYIVFKVYRDQPYKPVQNIPDILQYTDTLLLFALKRIRLDALELKVEGFRVKPLVIRNTVNKVEVKTIIHEVIRTVHTKKLLLEFNVEQDLGGGYLLDEAKLIALEWDDQNSIDVLLHLPFSQDYLFRLDYSVLTSTADLSLKSSVKLLALSNPFFGIHALLTPTPVQSNYSYFVSASYPLSGSLIRAYHLPPGVKTMARSLTTSTTLFNFIDKYLSDGRNDIEERDINTVYMYALNTFTDNIRSILTVDPMIKTNDYAYGKASSQIDINLYALSEGGTLTRTRISHYLNLEIYYNFLASQKISFIAKGPKTQQSFDIQIVSKKMDTIDYWTCLAQLLFVAVFGLFGIIFLVIFKRKVADKYSSSLKNTQGLDHHAADGPAEEKVSLKDPTQ